MLYGTRGRETLYLRWSSAVTMCVCCSGTRRGFVGHGFFFSSQVLHFENVKDVPFGFQTVTSDINKHSSFYSLKLIKRLYVDKSLNPTTVSGLKPLARFNSPRPQERPRHMVRLTTFFFSETLISRMLIYGLRLRKIN